MKPNCRTCKLTRELVVTIIFRKRLLAKRIDVFPFRIVAEAPAPNGFFLEFPFAFVFRWASQSCGAQFSAAPSAGIYSAPSRPGGLCFEADVLSGGARELGRDAHAADPSGPLD